MKYIVRYLNTEHGHAMYMIADKVWTPNISKATILNNKNQAVNLLSEQYPPSYHKVWKHLTILEYTDQEYFKVVLKG